MTRKSWEEIFLMLMGEEENGRDIEGFQATLYTQRKN